MGTYNNFKDAGKEVNQRLSRIFRGGALSVMARVIEESPVGNRELWAINQGRPSNELLPKNYIGGTFRGNWQASVGTPKTGIISSNDSKQALSVPDPSSQIGKVSLNDTLHLTNNLPYAQRLVEDGWSKQRPTRWFKSIIETGDKELKKAVRRAGG